MSRFISDQNSLLLGNYPNCSGSNNPGSEKREPQSTELWASLVNASKGLFKVAKQMITENASEGEG